MSRLTVMAKSVVLAYRGLDRPGDEAVFKLDAKGKVIVTVLNPESEYMVKRILKDGVYCHDDGDKSKMVMSTEGQRFLDNLLKENSTRYFFYYDPEATPAKT